MSPPALAPLRPQVKGGPGAEEAEGPGAEEAGGQEEEDTRGEHVSTKQEGEKGERIERERWVPYRVLDWLAKREGDTDGC
jgi:hypothetical protein